MNIFGIIISLLALYGAFIVLCIALPILLAAVSAIGLVAWLVILAQHWED